MAELDLAGMRTHARLLAQDTDTVEPGLSDANYTSLLNEALYDWLEIVSPRIQLVTSIVTYGNQDFRADTASAYAEIVAVFGTVGVGGVTPMERLELHEIFQDLLDSVGTGRRSYALQRKQGDAGKWTIWRWPRSSGTTTFDALVRAEVTALSGATDKPDVTDSESYDIARLAAARAAYLNGRPPEFVEQIWRDLPEYAVKKLNLEMRLQRPRPRPVEEKV